MGKMVIDEALLAEIESMQTMLKNNVAGMFGGNRQTKKFGSSSEFADYRDYVPGDDINKIDWNAYARFDKLYQKLYLDERQMHTKIYIDASRSMQHGSLDKAEQAIRIAAAFAYLSVCEMDKVSIYVLRGNTADEQRYNKGGNYAEACLDKSISDEGAKISTDAHEASMAEGKLSEKSYDEVKRNREDNAIADLVYKRGHRAVERAGKIKEDKEREYREDRDIIHVMLPFEGSLDILKILHGYLLKPSRFSSCRGSPRA